MSAPVFLAPPGALGGPRVVLDGPEGRHAATVRRLRPGERVDVTDGAGAVAHCVVASVAGKDVVTLDVESLDAVAAPEPRLVVVQALPKGDRGELAVELMTEVGVDEIVPWAASRCVTVWKGERAAKAHSRWSSTAREAAKQARRAWLPSVAPLASTGDVAARVAAAASAVVLHEDAPVRLTSLTPARSGEVVVIVGPEGGVAPAELAAFTEAGATAALLGPTVLRTSTAGAAAAPLLLAATGRW